MKRCSRKSDFERNAPGPVRAWTVCALAAACIIGCRVYPEPEKKTIDELYFDAVAKSAMNPEYTLGLQQHGTAPASPAPSGVPVPPAPAPLLPAPAPPADNPAPPEQPPRTLDPTSPPLPPLTSPPLHDRRSASLRRPIPRRPHQPDGWKRATQPVLSKPQVHTAATTGAGARVVTAQHLSDDGGPRVTEIFEETDLRQAIQSLASQAGVSVIVDDQVNGVANAVIEDEPFETALRKVLLPVGLIYRRTGNEYLIGSSDPNSPLFPMLSQTYEYRSRHLSPSELAELLPERFAQYMRVVEKRNLIIVEAPQEIADRITSRLNQADQPVSQVALEAIICVITPDSGFQSGLDWSHAVTMNGSQLFRAGMAGLAFNGVSSGQGISNAFADFALTSTFVRLLAQEGYLTIRAAPRVTAKDGEKAQIGINRETFFSTQPRNADVFFRQDIEKVEAGIGLEIVPVVRGDMITVTIEKAEVSEDIRTANVNSQVVENPFPLINRRTVSTTVHVRDGETIVIGGLVQRQTIDRVVKIPIIGHVPGLGRAFQTVEQTAQDAEVVIFISPRIIRQGSCAPAISSGASLIGTAP